MNILRLLQSLGLSPTKFSLVHSCCTSKIAIFVIVIIFFCFSSLFSIGKLHIALAQSASELQSKIEQRNQDIKALEKEIASYQSQINELSTQAQSLSSTIKSLELTQKKLEANIKVTENKIAEKNIEIIQLGSQISDKEETIIEDRRIIAQSFATMNELGTKSLPELLLAEKSLSNAWNSIEEIGTIQKGLADRITSLQKVKANLETNKKATEKAKSELVALNNELKDQRAIVLSTAAEKNKLLKDTKQSEAEYQKILAERKVLKEAFEREVSDLEDALKIAIDPNSIPSAGTGILKFPLFPAVKRITQYFGNTEFATKNPQIYTKGTHPGIDFAATIGTPVKAALSGKVTGQGNMDLAGGGRCRAYGKWIMVEHANGLSTLYAHLSLISVDVGQQVVTGEVIGYSGNTGASTGPHLHFGVYATEGVRITKLVSSSYCSGVLYPLADPKAYLNPLSYM